MTAPREWTAYETRYVYERAGTVPPEQLAQMLGRSVAEVREECGRLGVDCDFPLVWCPSCSTWRPFLVDHRPTWGVCQVCSERMLLEKREAEIAELLPMLPHADRLIYDKTDVIRGSRTHEARPAPPDVRGMARDERNRALASYQVALTDWEYRRMHRLARAAQKRKERIRAKVARARASPGESAARRARETDEGEEPTRRALERIEKGKDLEMGFGMNEFREQFGLEPEGPETGGAETETTQGGEAPRFDTGGTQKGALPFDNLAEFREQFGLEPGEGE